MGFRILLRAGIKRHRGTLAGLLFLVMLVSVALGTVLTLWVNAGDYIERGLEQAGFGELTVWVSGLEDVDGPETQRLVFSNYTTLGQESDSEGQLIVYEPERERYCFFTDDLTGYQSQPDRIEPGNVYVSPSLISMFGVSMGDEITFPIARSGRDMTLTVAGFFGDPVMGSSMIGMKGFLVCEDDHRAALGIIESSGIDALARPGAMIHIFSSSGLPSAQLNSLLNESTGLSEFTEFVHSREAISGFMLVLQNAFSAMLLAFAAVLLGAVLVVLGHSISGAIRSDYKDMGALKTVGLTTVDLRRVLLTQYGGAVLAGLLVGLALTVPVSNIASAATLTTTGIRVPTTLPAGWLTFAYGIVLIFLGSFIYGNTRKIGKVSPMKAIRGETENIASSKARIQITKRQLLTGKRLYMGALAVAVLLSFFAAMIGRMDAWLGPDGKGMMDAFNPADHDLGVQMFGESTMEQAEEIVRQYSEITDTYLLAMPSVVVNGVDYTANVISDPERFHILEGRTCMGEDEIVLTEFVAANLGVTLGNTVTVQSSLGSGEYTVTGIYSCANDMGDNVGMSREGYLKIGQDDPHIWCWHYFLADPSQKPAITEALETQFDGDVHVHENTWPGLFGIITAMRALVVLMYGIVAAFILIVTVMTGSRVLAAEQKDIAIYKAIGFTDGQQRLSFALRFGVAGLAGAIIGIVLSAFFTDPIVSAAMKLAGISNVVSGPTLGSALLPILAVTLFFTVFAYLAAGKIRKVSFRTCTNRLKPFE